MSDELNFDIFAMTHPKDITDIHAMLYEALDELKNINGILESLLSSQ